MTELAQLLAIYRNSAMSEREKGTYFEELILAYLRNEATYRDLYRQVWTWAEWAPANGFTAKDDGIDLVAEVAGTGEIHAIQCKFYDADYKLQKKDIDSFFTASGRKPFTHRVIVSTTNHWSNLRHSNCGDNPQHFADAAFEFNQPGVWVNRTSTTHAAQNLRFFRVDVRKHRVPASPH